MEVKKYLKGVVRSFLISRIRKYEIGVIRSLDTLCSLKKLTLTEREEVCKYWGQLGYRVNTESHKLFKTVAYYDKRFVPDDLYTSIILPSLNPRMDSSVYVNKATLDLLFREIPQAKCYVKNIAGTFWIEMQAVSEDSAIDFLVSNVGEFIIKPSCDSSGGKNVRKINMLSIQDKKQYLRKLFYEYGCNFIVQEVIRQHKDTAQFNPESLNTIRVCSLFLNDKLSILTCRLRCGQNGAILDNVHSGGIFIPIKSDGYLFDYGLDLHYKRYERSSNGVVFSHTCLENYSKIEQFVANYHSYFPTCHLIAWDLAITDEGKVLMVEVNINGPCIYDEQGATGPFFGDRTDEVIEYVKTHPGKLYMSF